MALVKKSESTILADDGYAAVQKIDHLASQGRKYFFIEELGLDPSASVSLGIFLSRKGFNRFRMKVGAGPKSVWMTERGNEKFSTVEARKELLGNTAAA